MVPRILFVFLCVVTSLHLQAADTPFSFEDPLKQEKFDAIIEEVRCLVCQNQSLADSSADLAQDLRQEIYDMVLDGKDDAEIHEFLVARYGDFVLYRPPLKTTTWLLWFGPFVFLAVSIFFIIRFIKHREVIPDSALTEEEAGRLEKLLNDKGSSSS